MKTYSVKEVCELLKVKPLTVRRWIKAGKIQNTFKVGDSGRVVIPEEEVVKFLRPRYNPTPQEKEEPEVIPM